MDQAIIEVKGIVPLTSLTLKESRYLDTKLIIIELRGVVSFKNKSSIKVNLAELKKALRKATKKE